MGLVGDHGGGCGSRELRQVPLPNEEGQGAAGSVSTGHRTRAVHRLGLVILSPLRQRWRPSASFTAAEAHLGSGFSCPWSYLSPPSEPESAPTVTLAASSTDCRPLP